MALPTQVQPEGLLGSKQVQTPIRAGIVTLTGYGLDIRVERGHLQVRDGIGRSRRAGRFHRSRDGVRRVVVLGHTGSITLDAIRWIGDIGASYVQIDQDGQVLATFHRQGLDRPDLRRGQARAWGTTTGMQIAVEILRRKLAGQARIARERGAELMAEQIEALVPHLDLATTPGALMLPEAAAANAYWSAWSSLDVRWAKADQTKVPDHWRTFGSRASPLTGNSRTAADPVNALLNYGYALLEAEARISCLTMGLDPGLGVLHADQRARDSLALDVMEAVRPDVDAFVLDLVDRRTFRRKDFFETRQGACRITPGLAAELVTTLPTWGAHLGPVVEWVAKALVADGGGTRRIPTRLTESNRATSRPDRADRTSRPARTPVLSSTCRTCGDTTPDRSRDYCDSCLPDRRTEQQVVLADIGRANIVRLRASGWKPTLTEEGRRRIGRDTHNGVRRARAWQRENPWPTDLGAFSRDIWPRVRDVSAREMARATGLSVGYCTRIRKGEVVPHPMWWAAFDSIGRGNP